MKKESIFDLTVNNTEKWVLVRFVTKISKNVQHFTSFDFFSFLQADSKKQTKGQIIK